MVKGAEHDIYMASRLDSGLFSIWLLAGCLFAVGGEDRYGLVKLVAASKIALLAVVTTIFTLISCSLAAEAPAPAPASSAGESLRLSSPDALSLLLLSFSDLHSRSEGLTVL
ncbi:unnamed protein product [Ilex paraguariensis]|uniref:Uncharacterized protein n=1 Tax=Ilex paraguariensis TaxID=185542 RepID=A0ABC8TGM7_9AQUA